MEEIKIKIVALCVTLKIETEAVCTGFVDVFGPELVPAYNTSNLGNIYGLNYILK